MTRRIGRAPQRLPQGVGNLSQIETQRLASCRRPVGRQFEHDFFDRHADFGVRGSRKGFDVGAALVGRAVFFPPGTNVLSDLGQYVDEHVPDEAAAATALATGMKVNNRSLGVGPNEKRLASIVDLAREKGRAVGLVTNGRLTNPTTAAFYATGKGGADFAQQLAEEKKIDIVLGGGGSNLLPEAKGGDRTDGRDLILERIKP